MTIRDADVVMMSPDEGHLAALPTEIIDPGLVGEASRLSCSDRLQ